MKYHEIPIYFSLWRSMTLVFTIIRAPTPIRLAADIARVFTAYFSEAPRRRHGALLLADGIGMHPPSSHAINSERRQRTRLPSLIGRGIRLESESRYTCLVEHPPSNSATALTSRSSAEFFVGFGAVFRRSLDCVSETVISGSPSRAAPCRPTPKTSTAP